MKEYRKPEVAFEKLVPDTAISSNWTQCVACSVPTDYAKERVCAASRNVTVGSVWLVDSSKTAYYCVSVLDDGTKCQ